ncbi:MAG: VOC family protein [bacterium]|nr:VOC family protein [bacterium]
MVKPIPDNYPRVSAALAVDGAADAIAFYCAVFGAAERMRIPAPGGKIGHAELAIGDSLIMVADEYPEMGFVGPKAIGGTPVTISVYVADTDAAFAEAVSRGARPLREVADHFYGDRSGQFEDPWGHRWGVATHIEDVSPEELDRRVKEMFLGGE